MYVMYEAGCKNPLYFFGAILPDIGIGAKGYINWSNFRGVQKWYSKIKNPYLRKGMICHGVVDGIAHGKLKKGIWDLTGYTLRWFDTRFPKLKAIKNHQPVEWFMELYVAKVHPEVFGVFNYAVKNVNLAEIAEDLTQAINGYYGREIYNKKKILIALEKFILVMNGINIGTRTFKGASNPEQDREKTLRECAAAVRKVI